MKRRAKIVLFGMLLLAGIVAWYVHRIRSLRAPENASVRNNQAGISESSNRLTKSTRFSQQDLTPAQVEYLAAIERDKAYDWKHPVEFYGKVVDDSGNPVPD